MDQKGSAATLAIMKFAGDTVTTQKDLLILKKEVRKKLYLFNVRYLN